MKLNTHLMILEKKMLESNEKYIMFWTTNNTTIIHSGAENIYHPNFHPQMTLTS
jgi:hypothetical protein